MRFHDRLTWKNAALALLLAGCSQQTRLIGTGVPDSGATAGNNEDAAAAPARDDALVLPDAVGAPDVASGSPVPAELDCARASEQRGNAGCSFYSAQIPIYRHTSCYALFVVNPGTRPARLGLQRAGTQFAMAHVARVPRGSGAGLTYAAFDEAAGLAPGDVAIVFLSGLPRSTPLPPPSPVPPIPLPPMNLPHIPEDLVDSPCPYGVETATSTPTEVGRMGQAPPTWSSAIGQAFHLTSDRPVVAYDINPFGGADSALTSASLLLPESTWGTAHIAATPPYQNRGGAGDGANLPSYLFVLAGQDGTEVALRPTAAVGGGEGVPAAAAGGVVRLKLQAGQFAQVMQVANYPTTLTPGLSGTVVTSNKPVGLVGGATCFDLDSNTQACDSGHQQIPPFAAWGHEYAAVRYRSRLRDREEPVPWQFVGAVDGTVLHYADQAPAPWDGRPAPAPVTLKAGETVQFWTADPFVVSSQDRDHPFYVGAYMTGGNFLSDQRAAAQRSAGDPEFVNVVPTDQYMKDYTFFTDPTYPETSLVVIRAPAADGSFADVKLGCAAAPVGGWTPLGHYQFTRVDLVTGVFASVIPGCNNGRQQISSSNPFAVTVWGWGTSAVQGTTFVSYAYPAGAALGAVNTAPLPVID